MWVITVFGGCALLLAAIGIYGLMAYSVEQRTREIGVPMALGAQPWQINRMIVFHGMSLAAVGVLLGLIAAFALAQVINSLLFGVIARDPLVFAAVAALLAAVALLAARVPARRASTVDPLMSLRQD